MLMRQVFVMRVGAKPQTEIGAQLMGQQSCVASQSAKSTIFSFGACHLSFYSQVIPENSGEVRNTIKMSKK